MNAVWDQLGQIRALGAEVAALGDHLARLRRRMGNAEEASAGLRRQWEAEQARLLARYEALNGFLECAERAIEGLADPRLRSLLRLRYVMGHSFERIGRELHYSRSQIWRLHKRALESLRAREAGGLAG